MARRADGRGEDTEVGTDAGMQGTQVGSVSVTGGKGRFMETSRATEQAVKSNWHQLPV